MKNSLKHYLWVYKKFISTCITQAASFRLHFFLLILLDIIFNLTSLASVDFIYNHVEKIGSWKRDELLFFTSVMLGIDQWHMTFISENFWVMATLIRTGQLDSLLIRPVHSLFLVFFRYFRTASAVNIFLTWGIIIHYGLKNNLQEWQFLLLPLLMALGFILLVLVEIILSCSMFWMLEGWGINFLRIELQRVSRWPDFIYSKGIRLFFLTCIPVLLVGNAPVRFLLNPKDFWPLLGLIVVIALAFGILRFLWPWALKNYESASS